MGRSSGLSEPEWGREGHQVHGNIIVLFEKQSQLGLPPGSPLSPQDLSITPNLLLFLKQLCLLAGET